MSGLARMRGPLARIGLATRMQAMVAQSAGGRAPPPSRVRVRHRARSRSIHQRPDDLQHSTEVARRIIKS